jgi:predicted nucleic acid-binding protein
VGWFLCQLQAGAEVIVSEVADYEVRRELLRLGETTSLARLDSLQHALRHAAITTPTMRRAAELWAMARAQGKPTADPAALDCDVIIAAQAEMLGAIVARENPRHLGLFVDARHWRDIPA